MSVQLSRTFSILLQGSVFRPILSGETHEGLPLRTYTGLSDRLYEIKRRNPALGSLHYSGPLEKNALFGTLHPHECIDVIGLL